MQKIKNTLISNIQVFIITSQGLAKSCFNANYNGQNRVKKQYGGTIHFRERERPSYSGAILVTLHFLC